MSLRHPTNAELAWIRSGDTGVSSETIWYVMTGIPWLGHFPPDVPHDPADFGRCHRLLAKFPGWRGRLDEVAAAYPAWGPMVREWDRMIALYERDLPSGRCDELYGLMRRLEHEGWKGETR